MSALSLTQQLVTSRQVGGFLRPAEEVELAVDQSLLHDVGGTMIVLELEAGRR